MCDCGSRVIGQRSDNPLTSQYAQSFVKATIFMNTCEVSTLKGYRMGLIFMLKEEHRELLTYKNITRDLLRQTVRYILVLIICIPVIALLYFNPWVALLKGIAYAIYMVGVSVGGFIFAIVMLAKFFIYSNKRRYKVLTDYVVGHSDWDIDTHVYRPLSYKTSLIVTFRNHGEYKTYDRPLFTWSKGWCMPACHLGRYLHADDECYIVVFKNKIYGVYPKSLFRLEGEPQKRSSFNNDR